jgi:oligopeptide transport system substrate-binding protein
MAVHLRHSGLFAAALLLLGGCDAQERGPIAISAIGGPPRFLNPNRDRLDTPSAILLEAAAQGLVRFDSRGEIEPALARRWVVSDDGLRYTFRLDRLRWPGGAQVTAEQVAARLRAAASPASRNRLKPVLGAIDEIVAMTDEVLEISLRAPRPNFLQLLAQPEMAVLRNGEGTGPYRSEAAVDGALRLSQQPREEESDAEPPPAVLLHGEQAAIAVARFAIGEAELVAGGTLGDLPLARAAGLPAAALRFDPVAGLLGLAFIDSEGLWGRVEARQALSMAIDRPALVAVLRVPGLAARESLLPPGIEGLASVSAPAWILDPLPVRRERARRALRALTEGGTATVRVALPDSPGHRVLFARLRADWAAIGIRAERVPETGPGDLRLIDETAPAGLASWYLRHFTCEASRLCLPAADEMMAAARIAPNAAARRGLVANADRILAAHAPYIPLAAPVRWSLVAPRLTGFRPNAFGRHPIAELVQPQP